MSIYYIKHVRLSWWYIRYAFLAILRYRLSPRVAWAMATACGDEWFLVGASPQDVLEEEVSRWTDDGDT